MNENNTEEYKGYITTEEWTELLKDLLMEQQEQM